MNVGDPKKAIVLSIVAVLIVSVAVFRSLPSGDPDAQQGAVALRQPDDKPAPKESVEEPPIPTIDAFSHPQLGMMANPKKDEPKPIKTVLRVPRYNPPRPISSTNRNIPILPNPEGITGNDQQPHVGETVLAVRLDAIVRSASAIAAFTVAGKSTAPYGEGMTINGHIKVIRIKESSVVIEIMKRRFELYVGQEVTL